MIATSLFLLAAAAAGPARFSVPADAGHNSFSAVFDAPLGERITAVSSAVGCELTYDAAGNTASGSCSVPLKSIMVDNEPTKTEHFQQWTTNKKSKAEKCRFEAKFDGVKLESALSDRPSKLSGQARFTVCGRAREGGGAEQLTGEARMLPDGRLRLQVKIDKFSRDAYQISAKYTDGWAARVQQLAPVVSDEGVIDLSLLAKAEETKAAAKP